jgi:hypothetical protein
MREEVVEEFKKRLEDYERIFGFHPVIHEMKLAGGTRVVTGMSQDLSEIRPPVYKAAEHKTPERSVAG